MVVYIIFFFWEVKYLLFYVVNLLNVLYVIRLFFFNLLSYVGNVIFVVIMCNLEGLRMFIIYMFICIDFWFFCYILLYGYNKL